jgi:hypothetical protein
MARAVQPSSRLAAALAADPSATPSPAHCHLSAPSPPVHAAMSAETRPLSSFRTVFQHPPPGLLHHHHPCDRKLAWSKHAARPEYPRERPARWPQGIPPNRDPAVRRMVEDARRLIADHRKSVNHGSSGG